MMYELVVIGGGPAGLAAAWAAHQNGLRNILIVEREKELGGILNQCIHNGFGLHYFKEELSGPEYAARFIQRIREAGIQFALDTMVLELNSRREITVVSKAEGYRVLRAEKIILAMGCRERTRGALGIPGSRPAGIFTAGTAQRFVNIEGFMVGRRIVILGSGDIGLIMARRMTLEGAEVLACVEVMPYSGGLTRNIVQCLEDFRIPLYLSHTVTEIRGRGRLEEVVVSRVDENRRPLSGTEMVFPCDTLLLSVGLIPENELSRQAGILLDPRTGGAVVDENRETSIPGIFACGNAVHVHDLVDFVSLESEIAGAAAARGERSAGGTEPAIQVKTGGAVTYTVPQKIRAAGEGDRVSLFFRVNRVLGKSRIELTSDGRKIAGFRRDYMVPGEMERIEVPRKLLATVRGELRLDAEEVLP